MSDRPSPDWITWTIRIVVVLFFLALLAGVVAYGGLMNAYRTADLNPY